jgi:uncharacterized protein YegJ (DUF2314 family)
MIHSAPMNRTIFLCAFLALAAGVRAQQPVPAGPLVVRPVTVSVFLRHDVAAAEAERMLSELAQGHFPEIVLTRDANAKGPAAAGPMGRSACRPAGEMPLPPEDQLAYTARRLAPDERERARRATTVQTLTFSIDPVRRTDLANVCALAHALAESTRAVLEDGDTRELFSPAQWKLARLDSWQGTIPAAPGHIAIRPWQDAKDAGVDTVGMGRFGLPELTIAGIAPADATLAAALIAYTAQQLVERPQLDRAGELAVHASALAHAGVRVKPVAGASGTTTVHLVTAKPAPGGARRVQLVGTADDKSASAFVTRALREAAGQKPPTDASAEDDAALTAASQRAQPRIAELKKQWLKGAPADASLWLKLPFASADGGREWMWVAVTKWEDGKLSGTLENAPTDVPNLKEGQAVLMPDKDVFDYRLERPGQLPEGGETDRILEKTTGEE